VLLLCRHAAAEIRILCLIGQKFCYQQAHAAFCNMNTASWHMSAPSNPGFESYKHIFRMEDSAGRVMPVPMTCIVLTKTPVSDIPSV